MLTATKKKAADVGNNLIVVLFSNVYKIQSKIELTPRLKKIIVKI